MPQLVWEKWGDKTGFYPGRVESISLVCKVQGSHLLHPHGSLAFLSFAAESTFQEVTGVGFRRKDGPPRVSARMYLKWRELSTAPRAPAQRPPPDNSFWPPRPAGLTSSAWPSSRSKVTTHTHSSQAEKRAQGTAGARVPVDCAPRRPRARRGPARDRESMAAAAAARSALPGERPRGVAEGTAPRLWPGSTSGRRRGAVERPSRTRAALPWPPCPLAAGGAQCSAEASSPPVRRARAGQSGPEPGGGTSGGALWGREVGSGGGRGSGAPRGRTRGRAGPRRAGAE